MIGGFEKYLAQKAFVQDKYIPYYVKWASHCYSFLEQPDNSPLSPELVRNYLNHISKTREDWQVQQAEKALRLYGYYLSSELSRPEDSAEADASSGTKDLWMTLEKTFRDALSLRHR